MTDDVTTIASPTAEDLAAEQAERERAEAEAVAAMLAEMAAANANAKPIDLPQIDIVEAPRRSFGPTFRAELEAAGVAALQFVVHPDRVIFSAGISYGDRGKVLAVIQAHDPAAIPPKLHATKVSAAQAKIALYDHGFLDEAEAIVAAHPYPPVRIWWSSANEWEMTNPYVPAVAVELGLDDEDLQELFDYAATR